MFFYGNQPKRSPDVEYLEWELEREREDRRRLEEEQERQREERLQMRRDAYDYEMRTAETWPEALEKQASLMGRESRYEQEENFEYGSYFTDSVKGCNRAIEIWKDVESSKQEKVAELQRQLDAIQEEIRLEVAKQLYSENDSQGWRGIASSIESDEDFNNWLNW